MFSASMIVLFRVPHKRYRRISTPLLNALRHFHIEPINLVIFEGPHNDYLSWSAFPA